MLFRRQRSMKRFVGQWVGVWLNPVQQQHGVLVRRLCTPAGVPASVGLVGARYSEGQRKRGVEAGVDALREAGLKEKIRELGVELCDYGDFAPRTNPHSEADSHARFNQWLQYCDELKCLVAKSVRENQFTLILGGDHSISYGSISGSKPRGVIHVDAHADIHTPLTSHSGNFHGMPHAFLNKSLVEYIPKSIPRIPPCLEASDLIFIGLRDVDPLERVILDTFGFKVYDMSEVDRLGMDKIADEVLDKLGTEDLHISFDIDSLDPLVAPATGTPVNGGLSLREGIRLCEILGGYCKSMDLVEINPSLAKSERDLSNTVDAGIRVIMAAIGLERRGQYILTMPGISGKKKAPGIEESSSSSSTSSSSSVRPKRPAGVGGPGDGIRSMDTTAFFRVTNFELYARPNIVIMGLGTLILTGCVAYIAYMRATYEKLGLYVATQEDGTQILKEKKSKWDV
ncbi:unnamed protein product [Cyprideis torosa]|uniref:Arginase n=1 Tax=Cyprideis torosa TaxID=163714 RepID=A0A7R8W2N1_9CRUS|nr:unnamed protein product [Cyprideis torosa]CAG0882103.1 unnamed protein product [Cyprideis torosa]